MTSDDARRRNAMTVAPAPCLAIARALAVLRTDAGVPDVTTYVRTLWARLGLCSRDIVGMMWLGQRLVLRWHDWRLGLAIGRVLALKNAVTFTHTTTSLMCPWG